MITGCPGADSSNLVTRLIDSKPMVDIAAELFGRMPVLWGRHFTSVATSGLVEYRTTAACRLFPLGEALPSTTSAGSCLPLFDRLRGTMASSDFSSAYMLGVRLLPSRACPARLRARVRPPRFRAKNFSTCARSPTARGSPHASQYAMG